MPRRQPTCRAVNPHALIACRAGNPHAAQLTHMPSSHAAQATHRMPRRQPAKTHSGLHGGSTWRVYMEGLHGGSTWRDYMEGLHGGSTWRVYMEGLHPHAIHHTGSRPHTPQPQLEHFTKHTQLHRRSKHITGKLGRSQTGAGL